MAVAVGSQPRTVPGGRRWRVVPLVGIGLAIAAVLAVLGLDA